MKAVLKWTLQIHIARCEGATYETRNNYDSCMQTVIVCLHVGRNVAKCQNA